MNTNTNTNFNPDIVMSGEEWMKTKIYAADWARIVDSAKNNPNSLWKSSTSETDTLNKFLLMD